MEATDMIREAIRRKAKALNEADAKRLLASHGVPVVAEAVALTPDEAVAQAQALGFPVVLKGLGERLVHKSERGLVALDLHSGKEVEDAFGRIREAAGRDWEGCLVQTMMRGRREFMAGFFREPQFGPVVMFGLGGILAEALGDVVFRIAPLDPADVHGMIAALSSRTLLDDFRGERAVDREQLTKALIGLSQVGIQHPEIREIDINPLIIRPDGRVAAVDALIGLDAQLPAAQAKQRLAPDQEDIEAEIQQAIAQMVQPRSIAVVGAKRQSGKLLGTDLFKMVQEFGFPGRLYPVNPRAQGDIHGWKAYPDLCSLPEIPDHVIISVPAPSVPDALRDCVAAGCKNVHIFTAGFKETGEAEGLRLQAEIEEIARRGGLHVIGPNCVGLYVPQARMVTWPDAAVQSGPVAFISQSGGHARNFTKFANSRCGIHFSMVVSYGNALTLDGTDFLKYAAADDHTRIIVMYLEGIEDGRTLFEVVRRTSREKPVIIFKAGRTDVGVRVAASHTGAMAGSEQIWKAFFFQSGAVEAGSLDELAALTQAFLHLEACGGRRIAVLGSGGGISVNAADACVEAGLTLPVFPPHLFEMAGQPILTAGTIATNPVDAHRMFLDLPLMGRLLKHLAQGDHVDMFIVFLQLDWLYTDCGRDAKKVEAIASYIATEGKHLAQGRPLVVGWRQYLDLPDVRQLTVRIRNLLMRHGVPVYEGMADAVNALSKLAEYHEFRRHTDFSVLQKPGT